MREENSCGTIIFRMEKNTPKFLLLKYAAGHWDFPKGHVEENETEEQTALRELEEETGITHAMIMPGFRGKIKYSYMSGKERVFKTVYLFLAETRQGKIRLSGEHRAYKWLSPGQAMHALTFGNAKRMLHKALCFLKMEQSAVQAKIS